MKHAVHLPIPTCMSANQYPVKSFQRVLLMINTGNANVFLTIWEILIRLNYDSSHRI